MKFLPLTLEIVMIVVLRVSFSVCGYDRQCPDSSQRGFRFRSECSDNSTVYNCLYNTKNKTYIEFCDKNEEARPGLKYVISGTFRNVRCSEERYQPIKFSTNRSTDCLYLKARCIDTGQIVFDNSSTIADSTCRCDYTRNYAFISSPLNPCFCTPSVEDCSCYIKQCPNNTMLSPDYECVYLNSTETIFKCSPVFYIHTNWSDMNTFQKGNGEFILWMMSLRATIAVQLVISMTLVAGLLAVVILIFHGRRRGRHSKISEKRQKLLVEENQNISITTPITGSHEFTAMQLESLLSNEFDIHVVKTPPVLASYKDQSNIRDRNSLDEAHLEGSSNCISPRVINSAEINIIGDKEQRLMKACFEGRVSLVKFLLWQGADINIADENGNTPFVYSCLSGNIEIINLLIDVGCDIHKPNIDGTTPLVHACIRGHASVVKRLIERGADINISDKDGETACSWSCFGGNIDLVNLLIDTGCDIHKTNNDGTSPLMNACNGGHLSVVKRLLEKNADINITDKNGNTPIMYACHSGVIEIINLLIDKGCDINEPNNDGTTPSIEAYTRGHPSVVKRLIERGADINIYDKKGQTALNWSSLDTATHRINNTDKTLPKKGSNIGHLSKENPDYSLPFAGTSEDFNQLLSTGTYESYENRVFLCGSCACGKSTLASILIGSPIPLTWKSTDGLVIHFGRNGINLETYEMVPLTGGDRDQINVLTKVVLGKPNRETTTCQSVDTNKVLQIAPSFTGTDFPNSNQLGIKKDTGYSSKVSHSPDACAYECKDVLVRSTMKTDIERTTSIILPKINKIEAYAVRDDILKEIKSGQYKIKIAPSDLVDFGGQRSYDMTHQLFIQHGGTFIVMFDGSRDFHEPLREYPSGDMSNECIVRHWVNSILTYCVDESDVNDPMPMIVFVATHSDLFNEDIQKMKKKFSRKITKMFGTHEMNKHIVFDPVFFLNNTDKDDNEIEQLKYLLVNIAVNQPSWGQRRPMIWVPLELLITNMRKDNINFILKSHLAESNTMNGDLSLSDKQLDDFLLTQHALGKIMYFNQPELNNFIILYPPALVNILRSFITDEIFWPEDETLRNILRNMTNTGRINKRDLLKLWQQKQVHQQMPCDEFKEFVIQVLVHLDVLVVPKRPKRHSGENDADVDCFLVPCTIKNKMPMSFLDDKSFGKKTISLVYRLQKRTIPSSLAFKLIGAVSGIWSIKEENGRALLYHSAAVLYVDNKTEFRIIIEDTRVIVYLTHEPSKFTISPDIAASIQECLTFTLNDVLKFYLTSIGKSHTNIDVSNLFQIEVGEVCDRLPCVLPIYEAKRSSSWTCCSRNQHFTKYPLLWIFDKTQEECPPDCTGLHVDALAMLPSDKHLVRLASQLDIESCRQLVLQLGLQEIHWKSSNHAYGHDALTLNTMVLYTWMNTKIKGKSTKKSLNDLLEGLKEICADTNVLCKVFREYTDFSEFPNVGPEEVPNNDVLNNLPQKLGNCALQLGVELGITISSIEQTKTDYRKMYDQTADILRKWKNSTEEKPTVFKLLVVLERVHLGGFQFVKDMYLRK